MIDNAKPDDWRISRQRDGNALPGRFQQVPYSSLQAAMNAAPSERVVKLDGVNVSSDKRINLNPADIYCWNFDIDEGQLEDGDIVLRLKGLRYSAQIRVNDKEAGFTQGRYSPLEYSIKPFLHSGINTLSLRVEQGCSETEDGDRDGPRLTDIFQSVSLIFFPSGGLFDIGISSRFDGAYQDAQLTLHFVFDGSDLTREIHRIVRWYLYEPGESDVFASSSPLSLTLDGEKNQMVQSELTVFEPRQWSAESPFLYNLIVEVSDKEGNTVDVRTIKWGFHQLEVLNGSEGGMLILNGQPVKLLGVNWTDFHLHEAITREHLESNLFKMKQLNINTIYYSGYPDPEALYEIADRIGLYIIKAPLKTNSRHLPKKFFFGARRQKHKLSEMNEYFSTTATEKKIVSGSQWREVEIPVNETMAESDGLEDMIRSHRNHASLIVWPLDDATLSGGDYPKKEKSLTVPIVLWVAFHELGDCCDEYVKQLETLPNIAGIFVWDDINAVVTSPKNRHSEMAELQFLFSPIFIAEENLGKGAVTVVNRHSFIDSSDYEIHWNLQREGLIVGSGRVYQPNISPGEKRRIHLFRELTAFPGKGEGFITLSLRLKEDKVWASAGLEIAKSQLPIPEITEDESVHSDTPHAHTHPQGEDSRVIPWEYKSLGKDLLFVRAGVGLRINLMNGLIEALDFGLGNILTMGITPEGENSSGEGRMNQPITLRHYKIKKLNDDLELHCKLNSKGFLKPLYLNLRLIADGRIAFSLDGIPSLPMASLGVRFGLQPRYRQVTWYGCGPHPTCSTRQKSSIVGLYAMDADGMSDEDINHHVCRNRIGVRWMNFSDGGNTIQISQEDKPLNFFCNYIHSEEGVCAEYVDVHIDSGYRDSMKKRSFHMRKLQFIISLKAEKPVYSG